jgi:hypothetical protein
MSRLDSERRKRPGASLSLISASARGWLRRLIDLGNEEMRAGRREAVRTRKEVGRRRREAARRRCPPRPLLCCAAVEGTTEAEIRSTVNTQAQFGRHDRNSQPPMQTAGS